MEQLGLKDSSHDLQLNCAINYLFYLYLMFYTCAARFDVIGNLVSIDNLLEAVKLYYFHVSGHSQTPIR